MLVCRLRESLQMFFERQLPSTKMDHILQKVVGSTKISIMDGFYGYNKIAMHLDDREKTTFTTPWGTFIYEKIPLPSLMLEPLSKGPWILHLSAKKYKCIVIYLDDMTVFSKYGNEHLKQLE